MHRESLRGLRSLLRRSDPAGRLFVARKVVPPPRTSAPARDACTRPGHTQPASPPVSPHSRRSPQLARLAQDFAQHGALPERLRLRFEQSFEHLSCFVPGWLALGAHYGGEAMNASEVRRCAPPETPALSPAPAPAPFSALSLAPTPTPTSPPLPASAAAPPPCVRRGALRASCSTPACLSTPPRTLGWAPSGSAPTRRCSEAGPA